MPFLFFNLLYYYFYLPLWTLNIKILFLLLLSHILLLSLLYFFNKYLLSKDLKDSKSLNLKQRKKYKLL